MLSSGKSYCSLYIVFSLTVAHAVDATAHTNGINFFMVVFISLSSLVNVNVVSTFKYKIFVLSIYFCKICGCPGGLFSAMVRAWKINLFIFVRILVFQLAPVL